jgi:hypothetical protein
MPSLIPCHVKANTNETTLTYFFKKNLIKIESKLYCIKVYLEDISVIPVEERSRQVEVRFGG